jgi:CheY-like chemotaxis protein
MCAAILVVEDDPDLRELLQLLLQLEGHEVRTAENGADAFVHLYLGHRPEVVLLNLWMPVVTGPEVLEVIRRDPRLAGIPVIVVSGAKPSEAVRQDATLVLSKPFEMDALRAAVDVALRGSGPASTPPPLQA